MDPSLRPASTSNDVVPMEIDGVERLPANFSPERSVLDGSCRILWVP